MNLVTSFSAGPSKIPMEVAEALCSSIRVGAGSDGIPLLELSDRSGRFLETLNETRELVRRLYDIPEQFAILIMMGGATQQFGLLALNLVGTIDRVHFVESDYWTIRAREEISRVLPTEVLASSAEQKFRVLPILPDWSVTGGGDSLFITSNNTAAGTQWDRLPSAHGGVTIVDASSDLFTRPLNFAMIDILFACAQKNFGIPGTSLVVIRRSILERMNIAIPGVLSYRAWDESANRYCTLPVANITLMKLLLERMEASGGVPAMEREAASKAQLLYDFLNASQAFQPFAQAEHRSRVNVTFHTRAGLAADRRVAALAEAEGLIGLKGHPSTGGLRASLYPAVTLDDVRRLIAFLESAVIA